jgi:hypothetical protein
VTKGIRQAMLLCIPSLTGTLHAGSMDFLDLVVPEFRVEKATIQDACVEFKKTRALVTLETVPSEEVIRFSLRLQNKTIREILDAIVATDKRYTWREHSNLAWPFASLRVINILPVGAVDDKQNLMNLQIGQVDLDNVNVEAVFKSPLSYLPELLQAYVKRVRFPGEVYSEIMPLTPPTQLSRVSIKMHDVTVRDILNELAIKSGGVGWTYDDFAHRWWVFP